MFSFYHWHLQICKTPIAKSSRSTTLQPRHGERWADSSCWPKNTQVRASGDGSISSGSTVSTDSYQIQHSTYDPVTHPTRHKRMDLSSNPSKMRPTIPLYPVPPFPDPPKRNNSELSDGLLSDGFPPIRIGPSSSTPSQTKFTPHPSLQPSGYTRTSESTGLGDKNIINLTEPARYHNLKVRFK